MDTFRKSIRNNVAQPITKEWKETVEDHHQGIRESHGEAEEDP